MFRDKLVKDMDHEVWVDFTHWCAKNGRKVSDVLADVLKEFVGQKKTCDAGALNKRSRPKKKN